MDRLVAIGSIAKNFLGGGVIMGLSFTDKLVYFITQQRGCLENVQDVFLGCVQGLRYRSRRVWVPYFLVIVLSTVIFVYVIQLRITCICCQRRREVANKATQTYEDVERASSSGMQANYASTQLPRIRAVRRGAGTLA